MRKLIVATVLLAALAIPCVAEEQKDVWHGSPVECEATYYEGEYWPHVFLMCPPQERHSPGLQAVLVVSRLDLPVNKKAVKGLPTGVTISTRLRFVRTESRIVGYEVELPRENDKREWVLFDLLMLFELLQLDDSGNPVHRGEATVPDRDS
jgi:hypothetical protein